MQHADKNDLGEYGVTDFSFPSFTEEPVNANVQNFSFTDIEKIDVENLEELQKQIKNERQYAAESKFKISPIVKEHRGLSQQEDQEREYRIMDEVNRRVTKLEHDAYQKGLEEGRKAGQEEVFNETRVATEEKLTAFTEMVNFVLQTQEEIINQQKSEVYLLLKNLTKWIILRELKDDGQYITRLLEKLVQEIQVKSNLLIKVNKGSFEGMEDVLETVQGNLGKLENVRVEIDYDVNENGLIVEAENGIIDGTIEEQFSRLDELFKVVGTNE